MAWKDSGSKTTPKITAFYAQKSTFGLGGPIFGGSLDCSKSELFFATPCREPGNGRIIALFGHFPENGQNASASAICKNEQSKLILDLEDFQKCCDFDGDDKIMKTFFRCHFSAS
jgi:hypothetical protein